MTSGNAVQHSQTEMLSACQFDSISLTAASPVTMLWCDNEARLISSVPVKVRARSLGEMEPTQSSRNMYETSNGVFQSIFGEWIYCLRNRTASTLRILRIIVKLGGSSLNKVWIGPAMNSNPGFFDWPIVLTVLGKTECKQCTNARLANGLRDRRCYGELA